MWSEAGLWSLRIWAGGVRLWLPLPMYVMDDLLRAWEDLCEIILPRFGQPNWAAALRTLVESLIDLPDGMPLLDVKAGEVHISCKRVHWGGL